MATFLNPHLSPAQCKFCGSPELDYNSVLADDNCPHCGAWQNEEYPVVKLRGHKWYVLCRIGNDKVQLSRVAWMSEFKRRGQVDRIIEVTVKEVLGVTHDSPTL